VSPARRAWLDFVSGLTCLALGVAALVESLRMPLFRETGGTLYNAPGLMPVFASAVVVVLSVLLTARAAAQGGHRRPASPPAGPDNATRRRFAVVLGLCVVYALGAVGRVPFWLSTFLFLMASFVVLNVEQYLGGTGRRRRLLVDLATAAGAAAAVTYVFQEIFLVRLP
jgi:putative tricarboxylic transport membrane protein